jgi:Tol biopolymer transport system component
MPAGILVAEREFINLTNQKTMSCMAIPRHFFKTIVLLCCFALFSVSCATEKKNAEVVVISTGAARDITRLTQSPEDKNNPAVSPDGKTVAFQVYKNGLSQIWTMDGKTGRNLVQVTTLPSNELHPSWMQDGKELVFASDRLVPWPSGGGSPRVPAAPR